MAEQAGSLVVQRLGRMPYGEAWDLQCELEAKRKADQIPDTLLILEHPPVITLGHRGDPRNVLASAERLESLGIELHRTTRGGDATYHGPGQVVVYLLVDLRRRRLGVAEFVSLLEEAMMRTARDHGVSAHRLEGPRGVFVGQSKLGAVGIRVSRSVTTHGLAFNVDPDFSHYELIVPCGLRRHGVTCLAREVGRQVDHALIARSLESHLVTLIQSGPDQR